MRKRNNGTVYNFISNYYTTVTSIFSDPVNAFVKDINHLF